MKPLLICPGCETDAKMRQTGDHVHYFINFFNQATRVWVVDNEVFIDMTQVNQYLVATYNATQAERVRFLRALPEIRD